MSRSIDEWIAKSDDAAIPPRVQLRVFERYGRTCPQCTRALIPGKWQCDHIIALVNGGQHRESNLQPLCASPCHSQKTKSDVAEKSRVYKRATSYAGITSTKRKINSRGFTPASPQRTASRPIQRHGDRA